MLDAGLAPTLPVVAAAVTRRWPAKAAAVWAFAFAALSAYWALGGMAGIDQLAESIQRDADERSGGFVATLWVTVGLKALAGVLALALFQSWGARLPQGALGIAAFVTGLGLTLYGAGGTAEKALIELGVADLPESIGNHAANRWYLFLWDPFWLLGGVLFTLAAYPRVRARRGHDPLRGGTDP